MDITCKRCGALIPADDVNLTTLAARCRSCNAVFSIADQLGVGEGFTPGPRLDVPLPERFSVEHPGGALRVSWRWFTPVAIFLAVFALFWNGFICFWVAGSIASGAGAFALFATLHVLAGVVLAYTALAQFLNTSSVEASYGMITVRHGPLPWPGNQQLSRDAIRQLYCVERMRRTRNGQSVTYELQAVKADGASAAVVKGLTSAEQALFLEQELERFLGIRDEPVRGELRK